MGSISSINFKPVKANSTRHNERIGELDYVYSDLSKDNESWKIDEISNRHQAISDLTKAKTGRKIQAKATPIREAVVNLKPHHSMEDLQRLSNVLKEEKGINAFQIHIHKDEGKSREELNYHAHIVFDWQDKETGKSFKLNRQDMSQIQDITARELGMDRGELKENSNRERLEAIEYKRSKEEEKLSKLQDETKVLEQKKNKAWGKYCEIVWKIPGSEIFTEYLATGERETLESFDIVSIEDVEKAIALQPTLIEREIKYIRELEGSLDEEIADNERLAREIREVEAGIKSGNEQNERLPERIESVRKGIADEEKHILKLRIAIAKTESEQQPK